MDDRQMARGLRQEIEELHADMSHLQDVHDTTVSAHNDMLQMRDPTEQSRTARHAAELDKREKAHMAKVIELTSELNSLREKITWAVPKRRRTIGKAIISPCGDIVAAESPQPLQPLTPRTGSARQAASHRQETTISREAFDADAAVDCVDKEAVVELSQRFHPLAWC